MRPTAARVRETLFNLIGPEIAGCRFLDLCAGSGSVGIEALSRGAATACFVDNHRTAISLIRKNISTLGLESRAVILRRDAAGAIAELQSRGAFFDEVFLDPPYESDLAVRCLRSPGWHAIMPRRRKIYVEHSRDPLGPVPPGWRIADSRRFGETVLTVFRGDSVK